MVVEQETIDWSKLDTGIMWEGDKIVLPATPDKMDLRAAAEALTRRADEEEAIYDAHEFIDAYPHDALVAFVQACRNLYNFATTMPIKTWFGDINPDLITVVTGFRPGDRVEVPLGLFKLPGVEEPIYTRFHKENGRLGLLIHGEIRKKDQERLAELADETRRVLSLQSIYKGKAIRLGVTDDGQLTENTPPTFIDLTGVSKDQLFFDRVTTQQLTTNLFGPIEKIRVCRAKGLPVKRTVLLSGPFGTGKSLTCAVTGHLSEKNGLTFIILDNVKGLKAALEFAKRYAPAVVFAEDIDRITGERNDQANDLVNMIDGVLSKGTEVITVLTTNHVEKIIGVMLRPGRLDAIINLKAPDAETVQRLIRFYGADSIRPEEDLTKAGEALAGQIPATIAEALKRARTDMILEERDYITSLDIEGAAAGMEFQLTLLNKTEQKETAAETLARSLRAVTQGVETPVDGKFPIGETRDLVGKIHDILN